MHRRGQANTLAVLVPALLALVLTISVSAVMLAGAPASASPTTATAIASPAAAGPAAAGPTSEPTTAEPTPTTTRPPLIDNDFLPEDANLSDCVGFVERPGCGSEARGGLQMTLIFLALTAGLAIIFWRVSVGVRRTRAQHEPPTTEAEQA